MANKASFLGWDIKFKDKTNNVEYDTDIVDFAMGHDNNSSIPMCTIKFSVDTSMIKHFIKPHEGELTLINKMVYTNEPKEIHTIKLQSVTNPAYLWEREMDTKRNNITLMKVNYMCKPSATLFNNRVGGIFHKKNLKSIIEELYQKTKSDIQLKLEKPDNDKEYECVMVPEGSFINAMRYLTQEYGLYNNMFFMFGDTLVSDKQPEWIISNSNKIKRTPVELFFTPYEQVSQKSEEIESHKYYTPMPINIINNFTQIVKKVPKMINMVTFDEDKFIKQKDIKFAQTLKELQFLQSNDQFEKKLERDKQMFYAPRFDINDYSAKDLVHKIGVGAYQIPDLIIPNPIKLSHFQLGTDIKFKSQIQGFNSTDITLKVMGWLLRIKQGNGVGGGATWQTRFSVRTVASSYIENGS